MSCCKYETISGLSHGNVPCLFLMDRIIRRLVVTFRRVEYSDILISGRPQDDSGTEELCSPSRQLKIAVVRLQKDIDDYRKELELTRNQTPVVARRPLGRSRFTSTPVPRFSGKSNWEQCRQVFEAIVCSNGWDDVTAALQLLSHLDGDALNVALLVPESRRVVPGFLIKSLSDHYSSPGRLAEYKHQFQRAFRRPADNPSIFAIELVMLARRAFIDIDPLIQLQMVRDRFIDGQAECALGRHLDSLGPETPMADIVDCCRVWESHVEVETKQQSRRDRHPPRAVCQVTEDEQSPVESPETELMEDIIRKLLPTSPPPPPEAALIPSDQDLLIQRLMGAICPSQPVAQERSKLTDLETMLLNWLPVGTVTEEDTALPGSSSDRRRSLDESFPFLPPRWQADRIGDQFILGPGPQAGPSSQQMGNAD